MPRGAIGLRYVGSRDGGAPGALDPAAAVFHERLDGYCATPLLEVPALASALRLSRLWIKDESSRFGLPAYKGLGAFYAAHRALCGALGLQDAARVEQAQLAEAARAGGWTLIAPTDGNHGHAVARFAALLGIRSRIVFPAGTARSRVEAVEAEPGATAEVVHGTYLDAVTRAIGLAATRHRHVLVTDFAADGSGPTPGWVIDGYTTIVSELDHQLEAAETDGPTAVVVQVGAAALAAAVGRWCATARSRPKLMTVEPVHSACLLASLRAGHVARVPDPHRSTMVGLNCDSPSAQAFAELEGAVAAAVAIEDDAAAWAMQALAAEGIEAGESGAAGLAGLAAAMLDPDAEPVREACGLSSASEVLVLITERVTDPVTARRSLSLALPDWPAVERRPSSAPAA